MHVSAPAAIRTYNYACLGAGDDISLRFCISQRRRSYGLTFMHMRASRASWRTQMLLWLEFPVHLEGTTSESIPNHSQALEVLVLSSECVLEPILESGERKEYLFRRSPVHVRALPEHQTLHLCMFERLRSTKHYTYAHSSAQAAFGSTRAERKQIWTRLHGSRMRETSNESTFGTRCTDSESTKHRNPHWHDS